MDRENHVWGAQENRNKRPRHEAKGKNKVGRPEEETQETVAVRGKG